MVTASHNPAPDNGYKVYDDDRLADHPADRRRDRGRDRDGAAPPTRSRAIPTSARITPIGDDALDAYLDVAAAVVRPGPARRCASCTRPLHGVGLDVFLALWERAGFPPPIVVDRAGEARSRLPHRAVPEPGRARRARPRARPRDRAPTPTSCSPTIPTPTGSRSRSPHGGGWKVLTGDEIGALLGAHMLGADRPATTGSSPARSCRRPARQDRRAAAGVPCAHDAHRVQVDRRAPAMPTAGASCSATRRRSATRSTPAVRDKDGLTAALAMATLAVDGSLIDALDRLAAAHGLHATASGRCGSPTRPAPPRSPRACGPRRPTSSRVVPVAGTRRLPRRHRDAAADRPRCSSISRTAAACSCARRGTEPKVKCYFEVVVEQHHGPEAQKRLAALRTAFQEVAGTMPG